MGLEREGKLPSFHLHGWPVGVSKVSCGIHSEVEVNPTLLSYLDYKQAAGLSVAMEEPGDGSQPS